MTTDSDRSESLDVLTEQLHRIEQELPPDLRLPFARALDAAHKQAHVIAVHSSDPVRDLIWPLAVTLLAYSSTQAATVESATALANAARAHAAVWVAENQVAEFRASLDRVGE